MIGAPQLTSVYALYTNMKDCISNSTVAIFCSGILRRFYSALRTLRDSTGSTWESFFGMSAVLVRVILLRIFFAQRH